MYIKINKEWNDRLSKALLAWKPGRTRDKAKGIVLDLLRIQREAPERGHRYSKGDAVVPVSTVTVRSLYADNPSRIKFAKWVEECGLVKKDRSWVSVAFSKSSGQKTRCDGWHITEPDLYIVTPETVRVEFDPDCGMYGRYKDAILRAEGRLVAGEVFHGAWAVDDYDTGRIEWREFAEVSKIANSILKGRDGGKPKKVSCRVFDSIALSMKSIREKCFKDPKTGCGMQEIFDIAGAITFTGPLGASALDGRRFRPPVEGWASGLADGTLQDPYKRVCEAVFDIDPHTTVFGRDPRWNKSIRKTVKTDMQVISNCDSAYLDKCERAYLDFLGSRKKGINYRRQWLLWCALRRVNSRMYKTICQCKANGTKDSFYRVHTLGEKMVMSAILQFFRSNGYRVHRVHDALWTTDERLIKLGESAIAKRIGKYILSVFKKGGMAFLKSFVSKEELDWVDKGFSVDDETRDIIDRMMQRSGWHPRDAFDKFKKENGRLPWRKRKRKSPAGVSADSPTTEGMSVRAWGVCIG